MSRDVQALSLVAVVMAVAGCGPVEPPPPPPPGAPALAVTAARYESSYGMETAPATSRFLIATVRLSNPADGLPVLLAAPLFQVQLSTGVQTPGRQDRSTCPQDGSSLVAGATHTCDMVWLLPATETPVKVVFIFEGGSVSAAFTATAACSTGRHSCSGVCAPDQSVQSCGTSCTPCLVSSNGTATCSTAGACVVTCDNGYRACGQACSLCPTTGVMETGCNSANACVATICNPGSTLVGGSCQAAWATEERGSPSRTSASLAIGANGWKHLAYTGLDGFSYYIIEDFGDTPSISGLGGVILDAAGQSHLFGAGSGVLSYLGPGMASAQTVPTTTSSPYAGAWTVDASGPLVLELDRDAQMQFHGPYLHRRQANGTWTAGATIGAPVPGADITLASSGSHLAALVHTGTNPGDSTYVGSLPSGGSWSWRQLSLIKAGLTVKSDGTPVVSGVSGNSLLVYEGTSSTPLTSTETLTPSWSVVAIDATGTIHVAFSDIGAQPRIGYSKRRPDGTFPVEWVAGFNSLGAPSLAFDPAGRPVIAFTEYFTRRIYFSARP